MGVKVWRNENVSPLLVNRHNLLWITILLSLSATPASSPAWKDRAYFVIPHDHTSLPPWLSFHQVWKQTFLNAKKRVFDESFQPYLVKIKVKHLKYIKDELSAMKTSRGAIHQLPVSPTVSEVGLPLKNKLKKTQKTPQNQIHTHPPLHNF